jgi:hypothetical protein
MEEIEIEEPNQTSLEEDWNGEPCPKCNSDHTYLDTNNPSRFLMRCLADGCGHEWSLAEALT